MALDTQTKRMSVQAYTMGLLRPVATGGPLVVAQRAMVTWFYSGLSYAVIVIAETVRARDSRRRGMSMSLYGRG